MVAVIEGFHCSLSLHIPIYCNNNLHCYPHTPAVRVKNILQLNMHNVKYRSIVLLHSCKEQSTQFDSCAMTLLGKHSLTWPIAKQDLLKQTQSRELL